MKTMFKIRVALGFILVLIGLFFAFNITIYNFNSGNSQTMQYMLYPNEKGFALETPIYFGICLFSGVYLIANAYKDIVK